MTTPDVPLRFELTIEVPGTPEQVWDAIATANGISSWMMPTDLEERAGGAVAFHMGPDMSSEGTVTGWDPPRRLAYEEPDWATFGGQDPASVTPLASEFLVEARSGGSCVVHVVSSAFGTGADWEQEYFDMMCEGWTQMFDHLRLYLTHFPGQQVTPLNASAKVTEAPASVIAAIRRSLGLDAVGQTVDARGSKAHVERLGADNVLLRVTDPVPGLLAFWSYPGDEEGTATVTASGYFFSEDASAYVERETPAWQAWLEGLNAGGSATSR